MGSQKVAVQGFEAGIVKKVEDYINQHFADQVRVLGTRIGLWRYAALRQVLSRPAVLCPDIDLLLGPSASSTQPLIIGVEAKAVYLHRNRTNVKFYEGLDEALALLRFGVDRVLFFQVFLLPGVDVGERDQMIKAFIHYPMAVRDIVRTTGLPIAYTPAFDVVVGNRLLPGNINVLDYKEPGNYPREEQMILGTQGTNPFLSSSSLRYPSVIRDFLLSRFVCNLSDEKPAT